MVKKQIATELPSSIWVPFFGWEKSIPIFYWRQVRDVLACVCRIYSIDSTKLKVLLIVIANVAISNSLFRCSVLTQIDSGHWSLVKCSSNFIESNAIIFFFSPVMTYVGDQKCDNQISYNTRHFEVPQWLRPEKKFHWKSSSHNNRPKP